MNATMLPFPYSLSCQPYIDVSGADSITSSSPSGTPSPPSKNYLNRCYENMLTSRFRTQEDITSRFTGLTSYESAKGSPNPISRKKSFTIEAILGLNEDTNATNLGPSRLCDGQKTVSAKSYIVPSASPRTALTAVFSTQESKDTKSRIHPTGSANPPDLDRYSMPSKSTSPNGKSSNAQLSCGSSQKVISHSGKMKRIRTIFTPEQLERLELEFERQQYMVGPERMYLASALGLSESQVKVWFQNRRIKFRKQHLEMQQARLAQLREAETAESENEQEHVNLSQDISTGLWDDSIDDRN